MMANGASSTGSQRNRGANAKIGMAASDTIRPKRASANTKIVSTGNKHSASAKRVPSPVAQQDPGKADAAEIADRHRLEENRGHAMLAEKRQ